MNELILFAGSVGLSFLAWGVVCARYLWPWLKRRSLAEAVKALLLLHAFRFVGVAFVVPGVVSPALQPGFAVPAAYGDLVAVVLAWVAYAATPGPIMRSALWVFNLWGAADLLFAFYQGLVGVGISPATFGAAFFIPTVYVPVLLITHGLMFWLLVRRMP
jgi:hypothetical protein